MTILESLEFTLNVTNLHEGLHQGFPDGSAGKESACNARDLSSVPGLGRSRREGSGNPSQYSCLENSMNRGGWLATVCGGYKELDMTEQLSLHF